VGANAGMRDGALAFELAAASTTLLASKCGTFLNTGLPPNRSPAQPESRLSGVPTTATSPVGEFTTPKLGRLVIRQKTVVSGKKTLLPFDNVSAYTASGTIELEDKATGKLLASGSFKFAPEGKGDVRLKLTKLGLTEQAKNKSTDLVLNSNWDQQTATDVVRLVAPPKKKITKTRKP